MASDIKLKVTIAKLIELSIDKNKDLAVKIMRSKGPFKITVDHEGNATLSGKAGVLRFKGSPALEELGATVKFVSVGFSKNDDGTVKYNGSFKIGFTTLSVAGNFDLEKLILSCSGLLCIAARALKNRRSVLRDRELEEIMQ